MLGFGRVVGVLLGLMILVLVGMMAYLRREPSTAEWIVFSSSDGQSEAIYRIRPDGTGIQCLTCSRSSSLWASWSPDGRWIVFLSGRNVPIREVYRMSFEGKSIRHLYSDRLISMPRWSPEGQRITFWAAPRLGYQLFQMRSNGSDIEILVDMLDVYAGIPPRYSPDRQWIIFTAEESGNPDMYKVSVDGSDIVRLTYSQRMDSNGQWSPDGDWIVYRSWVDGNYPLYKMQPDGSGPVQITPDLLRTSRPVWSPDGEWIVFTSYAYRRRHIFRVRADGSDLQQLTFGDGLRESPQFSPDGQWVVYVMDRDDGNRQIYRIRIDGGPEQRLTDNGFDNVDPMWSPIVDLAWDRWKVGAVGVGLLIGAGRLSLWGRKTKV